jgi:hypothetical protein
MYVDLVRKFRDNEISLKFCKSAKFRLTKFRIRPTAGFITMKEIKSFGITVIWKALPTVF